MQVLTQANEKYKGDALLQKVYTVDFLSKKKKVNQGEVPQYYVESNHEAIIPPFVFDKVQKQIECRCSGKNRLSSVGIFSGKIKCGDCGGWYGAKVWHSNDKYRRIVWQCNHKFDKKEKCRTPHLGEEKIQELFIKAISTLFTEKEQVLKVLHKAKEQICDTSELEVRQMQLQRGVLESGEAKEEEFDLLRKKIAEKQERKKEITRFLEEWNDREQMLMRFDEDCWYSLVECVTVFRTGEVCFIFRNGREVHLLIEESKHKGK